MAEDLLNRGLGGRAESGAAGLRQLLPLRQLSTEVVPRSTSTSENAWRFSIARSVRNAGGDGARRTPMPGQLGLASIASLGQSAISTPRQWVGEHRRRAMHCPMRGGWRGISPDQPPTLPTCVPSLDRV